LPDNPGHALADEYFNISTTDAEKVLELATEAKVDFVVAYASDPAAPVAAYVSEKLDLPSNSYRSVQLLSEKDLFRNFLVQNGFNAPKSISVSESNVNADYIRELQFPVIVKPTDSSGSKGVSRVERFEQIEQAIQYALSFSRNKRVIIEEFIEGHGKQLHGDGFVYNGELVFSYLGDHHYDNSINPFVPFSTTWPSNKTESEIQAVEEEISKAIKLSGFENGAINIEARLTELRQVYIMEIGPRSGGNFVPQVIHYAKGCDMVKATLDCVSGDKVLLKNDRILPVAYYVIHSANEGLLNSIEVKDILKPYIKEFHQYIQPGNPVKSFQGANAAIGILLMVFSSISEMNFYISNMSDYIKVELVKQN
jgi:biotin carboxylase